MTTSCSAAKGNGIDGAHILTPMPYLISTGKVTQNNVPTPIYILARLNLDAQAISVSNDYKSLKVTADASAAQGSFRQAKINNGQGRERRHDVSGRHPRHLDALLARRRRHRPRQGGRAHRRAPGADGREHEGREDGRLLRRRAVERAIADQGIGYTAITSGRSGRSHPEKALRIRAECADKHPNAVKAVLMATMEAQQWCDKLENKQEMSQIVAQRQWFNVPVDRHRRARQGRYRLRQRPGRQPAPPCFMKFSAGLRVLPPSRATTCGSSPRTSAGATWSANDRQQGADRQGQPARISGGRAAKAIAVPRPSRSPPPRRAARRRSLTGRFSTPPTRPPTSGPRCRSSGSASENSGSRFTGFHCMTMPGRSQRACPAPAQSAGCCRAR